VILTLVNWRWVRSVHRRPPALHSDSTVTEKYGHLAPETLDRAMEETFGS